MLSNARATERERQRIRTVELMRQGEPAKLLARLLGVSKASLYRWNKRLNERGSLACGRPSGRRPKLTGSQLKELELLLLQGATKHGWCNELWTGGRVREIISKHFGIVYNPRYVCALLKHRLNWTPQIPEHQKLGGDEAEAERWAKEEFPRISQEAGAKGAYLAFIDETGFMLDPTVRRTYAPRGKTPIHKVADIHARISAIAAITVSPDHDRVSLEYHLLPDNMNFRGVAITQFVCALRAHLGAPLTLIWDQTCIHDCAAMEKYLAIRSDVTVEPLPTYAPKLNPADGIWRYIKHNRLSNFAPPDLDELRGVVTAELNRLCGLPSLLQSFIDFAKLRLVS
jgi:transposase